MSRTVVLIFISLVLCLSLYGHATGKDRTYTLRFNTVAGPQQPQVKGLEVFAQEVEKLSSGKINVKIFHSGQLGNQQTQLIGTMRGTIDMTFTDPNALAQFDKKIGIFGAAYLFRDIDHMYRVMTGPIGKDYFESLANKQKIRPLDIWYLGTRQLNLRNKPANKPEDLRGVKLRMPNAPQWIAMGKALGANPTPLGFTEVYLALKTGVIDGQDNPLPTDKSQKFYEVTKYIVLTNHQIGMVWPTINEKLWQEMPSEYRGWILDALKKARDYQNSIVIEEERSLLTEFEKKHGLIIIHPDIEAFRSNAAKVYKEYETEWGPGMYDRIWSAQ